MTISMLQTFSISSAPSMIEFLKNFAQSFQLSWDDTDSYRWAANSYIPAYPGCHGFG